ncbi:MAG: hypothetical protein HYY42_01210 [Chloroflexi bacterium]|nr:hypothetical protein [Chloroflexota bacterium]
MSTQITQITRTEALLGLALACTSGAGLIAATFLAVPLSFSAPFVVLPTAAILAGIAVAGRRDYARLHAFARLIIVGAVAGLLATVVYDVSRPLLRALFGFTFDPFRAIHIFGELITGRPAGDALADAAGWTYHFWNGISFGMMFALIRPKGGALYGLLWAEFLQVLMMAVYPAFLKARLDDLGFLTLGIVGHGLYGVVLGVLVARWARA